MSPITRRELLRVSAGAAVVAISAVAQQTELEFYPGTVDKDPPKRKFNLFDIGIPLSGDLGVAGSRSSNTHLKLRKDYLKAEIANAIQQGNPLATSWPKKLKLETSLREKMQAQLNPVMTNGDPLHGDLYYEALVKVLKEHGADNLVDLVLALLRKESPILFAAVLGKVGCDYAMAAYGLMDDRGCAKPVYESLIKENAILVHSLEIDIAKSKSVKVANGTKDGIWLTETLYFQCHDPEVENFGHQLVYYPLWKCPYTTDTPISALLPASSLFKSISD